MFVVPDELREKILRGQARVGDGEIVSPEMASDLLKDGEALVFDNSTEQLSIIPAESVHDGVTLMLAKG